MSSLRGWVLGVASLLLACEAPPAARPLSAGARTLVLIHTADLHSHLFPEPLSIGPSDAARGLGRAGQVSSVGGFARIASIVGAMRAGAQHSLFLDSGDLIEGTAAYTEYGGEPELRAYSELGLAAAALGNHDLDPSPEAFADKHRRFAKFPVLAANFEANGSELTSALAESTVLDAQGIRVGVIGVANPSSPSGLARPGNAYGVTLIDTATAVQRQIDALRPLVDVLIAITHLGLDGDEALIASTSGLDVVLGGHQHLALAAALERFDCGAALQAERGCSARRVVLAHSGALGRYVGELDLALVPAAEGAEQSGVLRVESAVHSLIPVSANVEEDAALAALLEPYREGLHEAGFDTPLAFARGLVPRYASGGGDSALGDSISDALRDHARADLALINATSIRADLPPGELTRSAFVAALPFGDALTVLTLSGAELQALLNEQARVASARQCQTPIQISGATVAFKCSGAASTATVRLGGRAALEPQASYSVVTSTYLADGGSGFGALAAASARRDLEQDALSVWLDAVRQRAPCQGSSLPCLDPGALRDGRIRAEP